MFNKIVSILAARGKTADFLRDVVLRDDGAGPYIERWDEAKLGPRPTQEELDAVDVTKIEHNAGLDRQIAALEAQRPGYPRGVREFMLGVAQILAQVPGAPNLLQTPGMQNVKSLDDQIVVLRAKRLKD